MLEMAGSPARLDCQPATTDDEVQHAVFATLSDRLTATFKTLRGKGRLTDADIDATMREIRVALLEADVALPVVKDFVGAVKERARGAEVSQALNPAQQVIKIVNEELIRILGGETRRLRFAKHPPTVIMLAGLQGSGKTTLAGKLALWLKEASRYWSPPTYSGRTRSTSSRSSVSRPALRCGPRSRATESETPWRWPAAASSTPSSGYTTW
jgi:signal recognition particle GTPase